MAPAKKAGVAPRSKRTSTPTAKKSAAKPASKKAPQKAPVKKPKVAAPPKPPKKIKPKKKNTLLKNESVSLPHKVALSKLNPFRLPVTVDQWAIMTARVSGLAFVLVGAFFTAYHLHAIAPVPLFTQLQTALLCDAGDTLCAEEQAILEEASQILADEDQQLLDTTPNTTDTSGTEAAGVSETTTIDTTPDAKINVRSTEPLTNTVTVEIEVPEAERVEVRAYNRQTQNDMNLGRATKVSDTKWKLSWDTLQTNDGEYKLMVAIENQYGTYDQLSTHYYDVENNTNQNTTSATGETTNATTVSTSDTTADATDDTTVESVTTVEPAVVSVKETLTFDVAFSENFSEDLTVYISVLIPEKYQYNDKVELYLVGKTSGKSRRASLKQVSPDRVKYYFAHGFDRDTFTTEDIDLRVKITKDTTIYDIAGSSITFDSVLINGKLQDADTTVTEDNSVAPRISLTLPAGVVSGMVPIKVAAEAKFVELYAVRKDSLSSRFLGLATKLDTGVWEYRWNSVNTPNAEYSIYARVKTDYGLYNSEYKTVVVANAVTTAQPEMQTDEHDELSEEFDTPTVLSEFKTLAEKFDAEITVNADQVIDALTTAAASTASTTLQTEEEQITKETIDLLESYKAEIDDALQRLASAIRSGDESAIALAEANLENVRTKMLRSPLGSSDAETLSERIDARIAAIFERFKTDTQKTETIIRERVGEEISKDTDQDGITDFDEVVLYKTDPTSADTDNDGFTDGAEILSGFNPNDDTQESPVVYESPKETGITRVDILAVNDVQTDTVTEVDTATVGSKAAAVITGKALPNSYVTIYVFSTPVVVTVKTDADGNWQYRFDKELEDGGHEVYVGITDNTGRIVAKSEPFRFIKEAQAFTPVDAAASSTVTPTTDTSQVVNNSVIMVVLSISVVGIGITLILIGLHLARRRDTELIATQAFTTQLQPEA